MRDEKTVVLLTGSMESIHGGSTGVHLWRWRKVRDVPRGEPCVADIGEDADVEFEGDESGSLLLGVSTSWRKSNSQESEGLREKGCITGDSFVVEL